MEKEINYYTKIRKEANLTQQQASDKMQTISEDRLARIETEKIHITPDDILEMAQAYHKPDLCNYYCTHECPIGKKTMQSIHAQELSSIIRQMLASLNTIEKEKNELIEITADGKISNNELPSFARIQKELDEISNTVETLKLWVEQTIANGDIDEEAYKTLKQKLYKK